MYWLREIERSDLVIINKWRNDKELIDQLGAPYRFINIDVDEVWYDDYLKKRNSVVRCSIMDAERMIGLVSLTGINQINQSAEFHILIGEKESHGKGAGVFAIREMINHGFNNLNLNRIELTVLKTNNLAQDVYEKVGFKREGVLRKAYYKNGTFVDGYIYSILKEEFEFHQ